MLQSASALLDSRPKMWPMVPDLWSAQMTDAKKRAHEACPCCRSRVHTDDMISLGTEAACDCARLHAAIDALAAASEPVKDGEDCAVNIAVQELDDIFLEVWEYETEPPYENSPAWKAVRKLASLARRGRGHAQNCRCHATRVKPLIICRAKPDELDRHIHPFTDPRCTPLSEGERDVLEAHRRFHKKVSCPEDECYVCQAESALAEGGENV